MRTQSVWYGNRNRCRQTRTDGTATEVESRIRKQKQEGGRMNTKHTGTSMHAGRRERQRHAHQAANRGQRIKQTEAGKSDCEARLN